MKWRKTELDLTRMREEGRELYQRDLISYLRFLIFAIRMERGICFSF